MRRLGLIVLSGLTLLGCRHAARPKPAPPMYFTASYDTERDTAVGSLPQLSEKLAEDAPATLKKGKRVAFQPPDQCATESVTPSGASQGKTSIVMNCGALLAKLEAEVALAGYQVVSWQALKTLGTENTQERARKLGIDVIFEINELTLGERDGGQSQVTGMRFGQAYGNGVTPVAVTPDVANRCVQQIQGLAAQRPSEHIATLNLKAMDVASGRALWLYQRSLSEVEGGVDSRASNTLFFEAKAWQPPPPQPNNALGTGGVLLIVQGVLLSGIAGIQAATGNFYWSEPFGAGQPGAFLGIGIGSLIAGTGMVIGNRFLGVPEAPPPRYPAAGEVICNPQFAVGDPFRTSVPTTAAPVPHAPTAAYTYNYSQSQTASRDPRRERDERLTKRTTEEFVKALKVVAGP
ncbi:MAG: hypothetical protein ACO1OB_21975 [Archangium sp.]